MSVIDLFLLVALFLYLVKGVWRGALPELCSICGLVTGLLLASTFATKLGGEFARILHLRAEAGAALLFAALFLIGMLAFAILGYFLGQRPALTKPGGPSRVIGGLLGLGQGVVMLALVLQAQTVHPWWPPLAPMLQRGSLVPPFVQLGEAIYHGGNILAAAIR